MKRGLSDVLGPLFLLEIISGLWEDGNTRGMVCVVMKFRGCCSFVVRKMRESIHLKNEKLWHHLKMILD